jgi:hypothetical protein
MGTSLKLVLYSLLILLLAYEINLHIDTPTGKYNQQPLDFHVANGHKQDEYRDGAVLTMWAYADLNRHLPLDHQSVTLITYHIH